MTSRRWGGGDTHFCYARHKGVSKAPIFMLQKVKESFFGPIIMTSFMNGPDDIRFNFI